MVQSGPNKVDNFIFWELEIYFAFIKMHSRTKNCFPLKGQYTRKKTLYKNIRKDHENGAFFIVTITCESL
jgi:hypothetical protein